MFKKDEDQEFIEEQFQNGHIKRYVKGRTLGKGGFAECYEFISEETGKRYAAKVIDKETLGKGKAREKLQSEILIHKSLTHQHIVKFQHFFEDHDYVYILLELCSNNTLNQLLKRRKILTQVQTKYYIWQLLQALDYVHTQKVIHRDLKLGNLFLNEQLQLKVGDFGLATTLTSHTDKRKTVCGTPNYIAPEVIEGKKGHSYEVDIWSTGVIAFAMLFGRPPFETNEVKTTYEKIKKCEYTFPKSSVSAEARRFIERMLVLNPADRATIGELMEDYFMTSADIPKYLPLSSLACPPSNNFLEQIKLELISSLKVETDYHIQSSRTSKDSKKSKYNFGQEKMGSISKNSKPGKTTESCRGSMSRIPSSATLATRKKSGVQGADTAPLVFITFWEEHSKFGVFYTTNAHLIGMRFNDQTCLSSNSKMTKYKYVTMKNLRQASSETFLSGREPEGLEKKVKIINHFAKLLESKSNDNLPLNPLDKIKPDQLKSCIYLLASYVCSQYTLLWLSNDTFQASFKDNYNILVNNQLKVWIINQSKIIQSFFINDIDKQNEEIKQKVTHVWGSIKKVKKNRQPHPDSKKEKENPLLPHSGSQVRLVKKVQSKPNIFSKKFSSTTNLHAAQKRPLSNYSSNQREEVSRKHQ